VTADQYVKAVLAKHEVARGPNSPAERLGARVTEPLRSWSNRFLDNLRYTGSYAKETGVLGIADVDIFISLKSNTPGTLKELYQSLYSYAQRYGWSPRSPNDVTKSFQFLSVSDLNLSSSIIYEYYSKQLMIIR
jgi:hypothetical protein